MKDPSYVYTDFRFAGFSYSGYNLVEEVNQLNPQKVVDVGCGENLLKGLIPNLIGFDREYYPKLDRQASIEEIDFEPESVDVVLGLGSLQSCSTDQQFVNLTKIVSWLRPGGFLIVRNQPFLDYVGHCEDYIAQFGTAHRITYKLFYEWTEKLNLEIYKQPVFDVNKNFPSIERLVWWWRKKINVISP